jgi:hypothetical protein
LNQSLYLLVNNHFAQASATGAGGDIGAPGGDPDPNDALGILARTARVEVTRVVGPR